MSYIDLSVFRANSIPDFHQAPFPVREIEHFMDHVSVDIFVDPISHTESR